MDIIPSKVKDLSGQKFNLLTVKGFSHTNKEGSSFWFCKCDCGGEKISKGRSITTGGTKSCGCLRKKPKHIGNYKHGQTRKGKHHKLHGRWGGIKRRCYNENSSDYANYGSRGIKICEEWMDFEKFYEWSMNNGYKENLQIDRIDNDGDYTPENCRWSTLSENQSNKRNNVEVTIGNKTQNLARWSEESGIRYSTLRARYLNGDSPKELLRPVKK